jgi:hypothetical protein
LVARDEDGDEDEDGPAPKENGLELLGARDGTAAAEAGAGLAVEEVVEEGGAPNENVFGPACASGCLEASAGLGAEGAAPKENEGVDVGGAEGGDEAGVVEEEGLEKKFGIAEAGFERGGAVDEDGVPLIEGVEGAGSEVLLLVEAEKENGLEEEERAAELVGVVVVVVVAGAAGPAVPFVFPTPLLSALNLPNMTSSLLLFSSSPTLL